MLRNKLLANKELSLLLIFWFIIQIYLVLIYGIKIDGEAAKSIYNAYYFNQHGNLQEAGLYMYCLEIFLVYFFHIKIGLGYIWIYLIQVIINLIALIVLYKFLIAYFGDKKLSIISCFLVIICYPYQNYNTYLYTESLFFSIGIIYSCILLSTEKLSWKRILTLILLLILLFITRPTAIFFFIATCAYLFFKLSAKINHWYKWGLFIISTIVGLFFLNFAMGSASFIDIILPFKDERTICGVPTLPNEVKLNLSVSNHNSLYGLFYYVFHNSSQFFRLSILKTKAFFGLYRPYYSTIHNLYLIAFFYPLYCLMILAVYKHKKNFPISFFYFFSLIIIFWLQVILSCDEWHNRFFLTLVPYLVIPAISLFIKKKNILNG